MWVKWVARAGSACSQSWLKNRRRKEQSGSNATQAIGWKANIAGGECSGRTINPLSAVFFSWKPWRSKVFLKPSFWNHHECLSQLFPIHLNTYVMGLRPLEIFLILQCGDQILTTKVDPRAVRLTICNADILVRINHGEQRVFSISDHHQYLS